MNRGLVLEGGDRVRHETPDKTEQRASQAAGCQRQADALARSQPSWRALFVNGEKESPLPGIRERDEQPTAWFGVGIE